MTFRKAKHLYPGIKVIVKCTGEITRVIKVVVHDPINLFARSMILVECEDGNIYHYAHINIKEDNKNKRAK